mmetsp:Transcript_27183/g.108830  ORF Transcript_27183/g.108830 Transcript_27183/m.108830 type:complete len:413 (+) Transcript_27183:78-1316(+)
MNTTTADAAAAAAAPKEDEEPQEERASKRARVSTGSAASEEEEPLVDAAILDIRRRKLEARYVGQRFLDEDEGASAPREIVGVAYEAADAAWVARTRIVDGGSEEETTKYYLNAASGMDRMIDAYRRASSASQKKTDDDVDVAGGGTGSGRFPRAGDAIEVLWDVYDQDLDEQRSVWWRAQVLAPPTDNARPTTHTLTDGDESVTLEVVTLRYEARPEVSEPDAVEADVCFLSRRALLAVDNEDAVMQWRREGATDAPAEDLADEIMGAEDATSAAAAREPRVPADPEAAVDALVDAALDGALGKTQRSFQALDRDKQCLVADLVLQAKTKLKTALLSRIRSKKEAAAAASSEGDATKNTDDAAVTLDAELITADDVAKVLEEVGSELRRLAPGNQGGRSSSVRSAPGAAGA